MDLTKKGEERSYGCSWCFREVRSSSARSVQMFFLKENVFWKVF